MVLLFSFSMFEKFTKKVSAKATNQAVEGAKESLNDKLEQYSGIIKVGLVVGVIAFGGNKLFKGSDNSQRSYGNGQPIIINNYYQEFKGEERTTHAKRQSYQNGQRRR